MFYRRYAACLITLMAAIIYNKTYAEETKKIQDNSFLIEEAYNQEAGVIQHIQAFQYLERSRTWGYSFTQEWPVPGQAHQFSYTIPVASLNDPVRETDCADNLRPFRGVRFIAF